ncbi:hypothetical protein EJB05_45846, partial [Eragrostis curvula]
MLRASESAAADLWAKAAELERDFAGYKRRLAERRACAAAVAVAADTSNRGAEEEGRGGDVAGRGRRYEEYVRRRDERLRQEWRARMERKEAEMKDLWARLDRAGSRGRSGGDGGELASAGQNREDHVNLQKIPGSLEVKVKPIAPVTPRLSPATKLSRPRTSVPSSPASASPRLSAPDTRRRPSHRDLPQVAPLSTPRKENRLPPPPSTSAAAAPATPRPRTSLTRSRSMIKDRSSCSSVRDTPRLPRFQPPRTSCDSVSNVREETLSPDNGTSAVVQSRPCFGEHAAVLGHVKKACDVAPEPFHSRGRSGNGAEPASSLLVTLKDKPDCSQIAPPAGCDADNKFTNGDVDQSSDKSGSPDITGDSDTEPSYVYIKKDNGGEQTPRSSQVLAGPEACPKAELRSENKDRCNFEGAMESPDANTMADAEEASRRASSESLYSNVRSSFSQRSEELDASATESPLRYPPSCSIPPTDPSPVDDAARPRKNPEEEDAEKNLRIPTTPGSSVTVSITVQSPMDAMTGLKRFLTFGKKNGKAGEVATTVVESERHCLPHGDRAMSGGWATGDSVKARSGPSEAVASDDLDSSYVISPHVRSLQSFMPSCPANPELKEVVLHAKSPRGFAELDMLLSYYIDRSSLCHLSNQEQTDSEHGDGRNELFGFVRNNFTIS